MDKGFNDTASVHINDRKVIPAGDYPAALRLLAIFGTCPSIFGGDGTDNQLPRSAWQWVVRLPDGTYGSICHLVTLDPKPRSMVRILVVALSRTPELLETGHFADAKQIVGMTCLIRVKRQMCGDRDRPVVIHGKPLPNDQEPIILADQMLWTPGCKKNVPGYAPQWVRNYAGTAAMQHYQSKQETRTP